MTGRSLRLRRLRRLAPGRGEDGAGRTGRRAAAKVVAPKVVALGGGMGLSASLAALRRITGELTAVVTVADDGGSSGRNTREELGVLPPGDLRKALAALCGDDEWGQTWARVIQHRFQSAGDLHEHAVGNLLIVALWEQLGDPVQALDLVGKLLGAQGRVLPMSAVPLELQALVKGHDPARPQDVDTVRGQATVALTPGEVLSVQVVPGDPCGRAGGGRGRARRGLGGARAGVLVLLGDPAPAGAGTARRADHDEGPQGAVAEPRAAAR